MMKRIIFCLGLALASGAALAQEAWNFEDWDADDDNTITEAEFDQGFGDVGYFDAWDANDDGVLSEEEFLTAIYHVWDVDDDGALSPDEWDAGLDDAGDEGWFDV